tara:strand:- start:62 stop:457 length:396 start_codon:yes stop_codon:yes gene_type:complete
MNHNARVFLVLGAINSILAIILGAFGSHILEMTLTDKMLSTFQVGVNYQLYHSLALILTGLTVQKICDSLIFISGWLFFIGIFMFSGSLYLISLTGITAIGVITPIGGILWILAWALFAIAVLKNGRDKGL